MRERLSDIQMNELLREFMGWRNHCTMRKLRKVPKMFNFELLLLHGFSSKNREILHKAVLTPQEYEDYLIGKKLIKKWGNQKTCWGC